MVERDVARGVAVAAEPRRRVAADRCEPVVLERADHVAGSSEAVGVVADDVEAVAGGQLGNECCQSCRQAFSAKRWDYDCEGGHASVITGRSDTENLREWMS